MARPFSPKIVTANDLFDGDVIYMKQDCNWSRSLDEAFLLEEEKSAREYLARANSQQANIIGAYLADAKLDEKGELSVAHFREEFRATGPSNYFHGKQAML